MTLERFSPMTLPRLVIAGLVLALLALGAPPARAVDARSPTAVVEDFHATLLQAMKEADELGLKGRFEKLSEALDRGFDLTTMARVASTRRYWDAADDGQRDRLVAAFRRLSAATYASQFDGYSGQSFETTGERPGPQNTTLVATRLVDPDGDNVGFTYVLRLTDEETWRIADVLLDDSISQLAVRRSEYRSVLDSAGIPGLIGLLNEKADAILGTS